MKIATIEIDLAKNVFQVHGVDERGHVVLRKQIRRDQLLAFMVNLPPCVVGIEACGSVHDWARKFQDYGHTVRLMSPQFVKPYVKSNTNDAADAEAICEAVTRPNMRFVPIQSVEQQAVLSMYRVRQGFVVARTAQANQYSLGAARPWPRISGQLPVYVSDVVRAIPMPKLSPILGMSEADGTSNSSLKGGAERLRSTRKKGEKWNGNEVDKHVARRRAVATSATRCAGRTTWIVTLATLCGNIDGDTNCIISSKPWRYANAQT